MGLSSGWEVDLSLGTMIDIHETSCVTLLTPWVKVAYGIVISLALISIMQDT